MRKFILSLAVIALAVSFSCQHDDNPPTPSGNNNVVTGFSLSALQGNWYIKRHEMRMSIQAGFPDSTWNYTNHYNYNNSRFYFTTVSYGTTLDGYQEYKCLWGTNENSAPIDTYYYIVGNSIYIAGSMQYKVIYFTADSMILDKVGYRYFLSRNTTPPGLNNIESQLIGKWFYFDQLLNRKVYRTFKNIWAPTGTSSPGYFVRDSIILVGSGNYNQLTNHSWEVLYPTTSAPIMLNGYNLNCSGGFGPTYITNITATTYTEDMIGTLVNYGPIVWTKQ